MWFKFLLKLLAVIWALPNTLLGSVVGLIGLPIGGEVRFVDGAIEFHGSLIRTILGWFPNNICAITLGHSILGIDSQSLEIAREHEHVHVRQYERWGPFFIPAYLLSSLVLKLKGKNAYYDNPFEVEAYSLSSPDFGGLSSDGSKESAVDDESADDDEK